MTQDAREGHGHPPEAGCVLISGVPGAGKSTVAPLVAARGAHQR
ncbi:hypothetical protein [Streptomyces cacaoi]|nr:hypothetical protein [Streptomyces cacaoi]